MQGVFPLKDCFIEFVDTYGFNVGENLELKKSIARFLGVKNETFHRWCGGSLPRGVEFIKLMHFLHFLGYNIVEINIMSELICKAGKFILFNVFSIDDVARQITIDTDALFRVMRGERDLSYERAEKLSTMCNLAQNVKTLFENRAEFERNFASILNVGSQKPPISQEPPVVHPLQNELSANTEDLNTDVEILANLIKAALPVAKRINERGVPENRAKLRELLRSGHTNLVFQLSNTMTMLCSEEARRRS